MDKIKLLFLVSGNGGTMKFFHKAIEKLKIDASIVAVIADRECGAVDYAIKNHIPTIVFKHWKEETAAIANEIRLNRPDIVVTNIYKILPSEMFKCCNARFLNLHYSLLPAFGGVIGFKTLEMAKEANTQIIGVTCHYVSEKVDAGKVISQAAIPVEWDAPFDVIGNRVFRIACECFLNGLLLVCNQRIGHSSFNNNVIYSPQLRYDNSLFTESFWHLIKEL